ncbi:MAG TPA: hypothetical protein VGG39_13850 [Polyangiaceae bacterium]
MWPDWQLGVPPPAVDDAVAPRIVKDYDELALLPLDEEQALVMTYLDDRATVSVIAERSGLPAERVRSAVRRLVALGAVAVTRS